MVHFRPGSQVWQLTTLLSFVGEFPFQSLSLLGSERVYKTLISKLTSVQTFRHFQTGTEMTCRLLTVSGKGSNKTIRLYKGALPILDWVHPDAYRYYMDTFWNHRFPGDTAHRERNHRVAETAVICMKAGVEARPYLLPKLQNLQRLRLISDASVLYPAKDLKRIGGTEMNKTMFTRMTGALFSCGNCYAVYNTRDATMKWSGMGEFKALHSLIETARLNAGISQVNAAILFGRSEKVALDTLMESDKSRRMEFRFDSVYNHIYFIPMEADGIRQLRLLTVPDWNGQLLDLLFEPETRSYGRGLFEYDACVDNVYVLSHLDGDIARLIRFREAVENQKGQFEVLCFPHQTQFLREYIGPFADIKIIQLDLVESEFSLEGRDLFGG